MPNLPCVVQAGAMVFARGEGASDEDAALLQNLLNSCGLCEEVPESYINTHTGLSGSGVAYVYLFAEALAEGAVKMGMPGGLASRIAAQTLLGAAKMLLESGEHPAKLRGDVCTPGGTTIHGLHQLEKGALRATVMNAVEAATQRARDGTAAGFVPLRGRIFGDLVAFRHPRGTEMLPGGGTTLDACRGGCWC
uniref:pyrroline-5-carboxylate reductase n=1 Tax=Anas platyrhynchos platyrhynchos TaxID=8840 RepID=U3ILQ8_ANAPP